ncbi:MAG: alpha-L-rhamnosidase N-terminal domain-containing protein, partial [Halanaerobiales bacterium]
MDKKWQAKWIMDPQFFAVKPPDLFHREQEDFTEPEHRKDLMNHHMLIRKKFNLSEVPKKAVIDITADDYYKLYINGEFIGQGPAPSYYFHYYYNNYEITDKLKKGENVIAVHVYYQGLINRVWNSGDYRQGMIAELFADNNLVLASGEDWKYEITPAYKSGGTTGYETQFLENFDSRAYLPGWQEINFDDSEWENVWVNITDDHCLYRQKTPSVTVYDVQPEVVKKLAPGHFFIDFGGELTGQLQLEAEGQ